MPTLPTQSFQTIVSNTVAGMQGRSSKLINFAIGSTLRAISEGFAGVFLWFQALVLQLLLSIRLSTSTGTDVDTFCADFMPVIPGSQTAALPNGSPRLGAEAASGQVTLARFTASPSAPFIPAASGVSAAGVITNAGPNAAGTVRTNDGSQTFVVIADTLYASYSPTLGGYTMPSGVQTLVIPVQAIVPGSAGNVAAGAISRLASSIPGVDTVTNAANFTNGVDQETDAQLKARFAAYILGLSRGDIYGLTSAIMGAEVNVQWTLTEGFNLDGTYHPGYYFVVVDDGSGAPSQAFLQMVSNAVNSVRPLSNQFGVFPPTVIQAIPSLQITTAPGYLHPTVVSQVAAAIATNINGLGLGVSLPYTQIAAWAYGVPGVTAVSAVELNGLIGDAASLSATKLASDGLTQIAYATIKCSSVIVS